MNRSASVTQAVAIIFLLTSTLVASVTASHLREELHACRAAKMRERASVSEAGKLVGEAADQLAQCTAMLRWASDEIDARACGKI